MNALIAASTFQQVFRSATHRQRGGPFGTVEIWWLKTPSGNKGPAVQLTDYCEVERNGTVDALEVSPHPKVIDALHRVCTAGGVLAFKIVPAGTVMRVYAAYEERHNAILLAEIDPATVPVTDRPNA